MSDNEKNFDQTLDISQLKQQLQHYKQSEVLIEEIIIKRPNLFSKTTLWISDSDFGEIKDTIRLIDNILNLNKSKIKNESSGVFMGFDFHMTERGPQLIEINTNAGGGLLNLELTKAQIKNDTNFPTKLNEQFFNMFLNEWKVQKSNQELKVIALVDEQPEKQFLYPEFILFKELIESHGIKCLICDSSSLIYKDNSLYCHNDKIDLVYNRLTDFYLSNPSSQALLKAYKENSVVLTPSPYHFQVYANKANLSKLTDIDYLESIGLDTNKINTLLQHIPRTSIVNSLNASELWSDRKNYFFKPFIGYGSKATYRGDKLTKRVWNEILQGDYVAQQLIPPSKRKIHLEGKEMEFKVDVRAYVYEGEIQLMAARLYSGQTTNFRTPGGGFAPVFVIS